jgi:hypothetical protein
MVERRQMAKGGMAVFSGGQRSRTAEIFGASGDAPFGFVNLWRVGLLPDRKIFNMMKLHFYAPLLKNFGASGDAPSSFFSLL